MRSYEIFFICALVFISGLYIACFHNDVDIRVDVGKCYDNAGNEMVNQTCLVKNPGDVYGSLENSVVSFFLTFIGFISMLVFPWTFGDDRK